MNLRYFWRSVASVLVVLFVLSPTLCYASETEINITTESAILSDFAITDNEIASGLLLEKTAMCLKNSSGNNTYPSIHTWVEFASPYSSSYQSSNLNSYWKLDNDFIFMVDFKPSTEFELFDANTVIDLSLSGLNFSYQNGYTWSTNLGGGSGNYEEVIDTSNLVNVTMHLFPNYAGPSGSWSGVKTFDVTNYVNFNNSNNTFGLNITDFQIPIDVKFIRFEFLFDNTADDLNSSNTHSGFSGWTDTGTYFVNFIDSTFRYTEVDQTTGLLSGIIEWLRSIRDGIVNVKDGVTNVFNAITELPAKLWTAIENGLKGLFVPSESDMVAYKDKWDILLSQRFGVVYQSGTIITDTLGSITEQSAQGTINLPATTIHFADTDFTFGGYDVPVVPQGFEWLVEIIKGLIDIVITVAFINAMRTKYDQLMRG